jgi:uncharacterized protein YoxC
MATLRQAIDFAKQNPQDARSLKLMESIKSGQMDDTAKEEGIDLTGKSKTFQKNTFERIQEDLTERKEDIQEAISFEGDTQKSLIGSATEAGAIAAGAISNTAYEALPEGARNILDKIGGGIGEGFNYLTEKLGESKFLQEAVQGDTSKLEEALQIASDLGVIAGEVTAVAELPGVAKTASQVARKGAEKASSAGGKIASTVKKKAKDFGDTTGISEAIPTPERIVEFQTTRALDLTQGDVKNISKSTGNELGEWLAEKNLIGKNKEVTTEMVQKFGNESFDKVREEIRKVDKTFNTTEVPRYEQGLREILKKTENTAGLEDVTSEATELLSKKQINLEDVQRVKELLDEQFSLYKVTGDVKDSVSKKGLSNLRSEIKEFIETQVDEAGGADIKQLNNNVATSRAITEAISDRSTRGLTRSSVGLGDLGIFGVGSTFGGPVGGLVAVAGKKILDSSAVRLRFAKWLDTLSDAKKAQLANQLKKGDIPKEMVEAIKLEVPKGAVLTELNAQAE